MLALINAQDMTVALVVRDAMPALARAVDAVYERLRTGGRLFYVGAGSSGLLAALDAFECTPTYGVPREMVQAIVAEHGMLGTASAEDDGFDGRKRLAEAGLTVPPPSEK